MQDSILTVPRVRETFELALEDRHADGLGMVSNFSRIHDDIRYIGGGVHQPRVRKFQLIEIGPFRYWEEVIAKHGKKKIPEGQWMEAFRVKYPRPDGNGSIGIFNPMWLMSGIIRCFPCVLDINRSGVWIPDYYSIDSDFTDDWRSIIEVAK